jgi:hypothetical protein
MLKLEVGNEKIALRLAIGGDRERAVERGSWSRASAT